MLSHVRQRFVVGQEMEKQTKSSLCVIISFFIRLTFIIDHLSCRQLSHCETYNGQAYDFVYDSFIKL